MKDLHGNICNIVRGRYHFVAFEGLAVWPWVSVKEIACYDKCKAATARAQLNTAYHLGALRKKKTGRKIYFAPASLDGYEWDGNLLIQKF